MSRNEPKKAIKHVAIIGSVGIPNRYGGPEAFAESIAPVLVSQGSVVTVTCDSSRYHDNKSPIFKGVHRKFISVGANGATSPLHDLLAFLIVLRKADSILVLGVSAGVFFPIFRLLCALCGSRLIVNIDGIEWRRPKFNRFAKSVLYVSDWLAQQFSNVVIYDNEALKPYVLFPAKSFCVEYSGDHALQTAGNRSSANSQKFALSICRIEPENNCHILLEGFLKSTCPKYIFVGNWDRSEYGRQLRKQYAGEARLSLVDAIYDQEAIYDLRSRCEIYLHGHSVGGTNPSLVEILSFDCRIFCWDCSFNRTTAGNAAEYFSSAGELGNLLSSSPKTTANRAEVRARYSTSVIVSKLTAAFLWHS